MFLFQRNGRWHVEYTDKATGRARRISTHCKRKQDAVAFVSQLVEKLAEREKHTPDDHLPYIGDFFERYEAFLVNGYSRHYVRSVKSTFRVLKEFLVKNKRTPQDTLQSLDLSLLERFFGERIRQSPYAASLYYRTLKAALSKAVEWEYLVSNPVKKIKSPKVAKKLPAFISEGELELICMKAHNPQFADLFRFGFHTGMRLSEILNLQWNSIDMTEKMIKVANTETFTTKSKEERMIPINDILFQLLARIRPKVLRLGRNYVFPKQGGQHYAEDFVSKKFKKAVRLAGVGEDIHFHSLRHSFASHLIRRGVPIVAVQELLGHADLTTTMIYSHVKRDDLINAVKMLEK